MTSEEIQSSRLTADQETLAQIRQVIAEMDDEQKAKVGHYAEAIRQMINADGLAGIAVALIGAEIAAMPDDG